MGILKMGLAYVTMHMLVVKEALLYRLGHVSLELTLAQPIPLLLYVAYHTI
jgi:hypothetical protein